MDTGMHNEHEKKCRACEMFMPLSAFEPDKTVSSGRRSTCRKCRSAQKITNFDPNKVRMVCCRGCNRTLLQTPEMFYKHSRSFNGLYKKCKSCMDKDAEAYRKNNPESNKRNPQTKFRGRLRAYGITVNQYETMLQEQNGCCAICSVNIEGEEQVASRVRRKAFIDHNHETAAVRALLCSHCNTAIGMIGDNIDVAKSIVDYLTKHQNS